MPMRGLMQEWPLLCHTIIDHAARNHPDRRIATRSVEGPIVSTTYGAVRQRALKVAQRLAGMGIRAGDRVGTLAWNTARHMEVWYGITGVGAIYHTVNPRLFHDQITYIINHAEDRLLFLDLNFVEQVEKLAETLKTVEAFIVLTDRENMPDTSLKNAICYEDWVTGADGDFAWVEVDENAGCGICYTSGTTGHPKGVVYSHRSNVLHALSVNMADFFGCSVKDVVMPVVPMFHANGWSLAFSAPMAGSEMVMPGRNLDGESLCSLINEFGVTMSAGVPTIWLGLQHYLQETGKKMPSLRRLVIGGSAVPFSSIRFFEEEQDAHVLHAWGMTEMSPIGTFGSLKPEYAALPREERYAVQTKQGHSLYTVEMKITDDDGNRLPWDGKTFGRLKCKGPAVAKAYFKGEGGEVLDAEGFFDTGDVATIDENGYMNITDRAKDVIKSGGEWISSIELENLAVGHPDVAEAAVIGLHHPKWDERPLLVIVAKDGKSPAKEDILGFMTDKVAKWWLPDDIVFVDEIPHTATGKIQKTELRKQFADYTLPTVDGPR